MSIETLVIGALLGGAVVAAANAINNSRYVRLRRDHENGNCYELDGEFYSLVPADALPTSDKPQSEQG
jgi:UDP-galactopyranose mutase